MYELYNQAINQLKGNAPIDVAIAQEPHKSVIDGSEISRLS